MGTEPLVLAEWVHLMLVAHFRGDKEATATFMARARGFKLCSLSLRILGFGQALNYSMVWAPNNLVGTG